jgi:hypothetical protein
MNFKILSPFAVLAAIAAATVLPVNAFAVTTTFSVVGILAILYADYGREIRPLRTEGSTINFPSPGRSAAALREAA